MENYTAYQLERIEEYENSIAELREHARGCFGREKELEYLQRADDLEDELRGYIARLEDEALEEKEEDEE